MLLIGFCFGVLGIKKEKQKHNQKTKFFEDLQMLFEGYLAETPSSCCLSFGETWLFSSFSVQRVRPTQAPPESPCKRFWPVRTLEKEEPAGTAAEVAKGHRLCGRRCCTSQQSCRDCVHNLWLRSPRVGHPETPVVGCTWQHCCEGSRLESHRPLAL